MNDKKSPKTSRFSSLHLLRVTLFGRVLVSLKSHLFFKKSTRHGVYRPCAMELSCFQLRLACKTTDEQQMSRRCGSAGFVAPEAEWGGKPTVFLRSDQRHVKIEIWIFSMKIPFSESFKIEKSRI